jgi:hypothetical protein
MEQEFKIRADFGRQAGVFAPPDGVLIWHLAGDKIAVISKDAT